jgi:hypothetical protein
MDWILLTYKVVAGNYEHGDAEVVFCVMLP